MPEATEAFSPKGPFDPAAGQKTSFSVKVDIPAPALAFAIRAEAARKQIQLFSYNNTPFNYLARIGTCQIHGSISLARCGKARTEIWVRVQPIASVSQTGIESSVALDAAVARQGITPRKAYRQWLVETVAAAQKIRTNDMTWRLARQQFDLSPLDRPPQGKIFPFQITNPSSGAVTRSYPRLATMSLQQAFRELASMGYVTAILLAQGEAEQTWMAGPAEQTTFGRLLVSQEQRATLLSLEWRNVTGKTARTRTQADGQRRSGIQIGNFLDAVVRHARLLEAPMPGMGL